MALQRPRVRLRAYRTRILKGFARLDNALGSLTICGEVIDCEGCAAVDIGKGCKLASSELTHIPIAVNLWWHDHLMPLRHFAEGARVLRAVPSWSVIAAEMAFAETHCVKVYLFRWR